MTTHTLNKCQWCQEEKPNGQWRTGHWVFHACYPNEYRGGGTMSGSWPTLPTNGLKNMDGSVAQFEGISKMLGGKTLAQSLKEDRKQDEEEFRASAGWTFDPTKFRFRVLKHFNHRASRKVVGEVPFEWYAEKQQKRRKGTLFHIYHIRRKTVSAGGLLVPNYQYVIRKTTRDYESYTDNPTRVWDCTISDKDGAREVLVTLGAIR